MVGFFDLNQVFVLFNQSFDIYVRFTVFFFFFYEGGSLHSIFCLVSDVSKFQTS